MKKITLTILILFIATLAICQTSTPPTTPVSKTTIPAVVKPTFQPDYNKVRNITLSFSISAFSDMLSYINNPKAIETSDKLSGKQIESIKQNYKAILDTLVSKINNTILLEQTKFIQDTTEKYHPKLKH